MVKMNPSGTGKPARDISPRFAAFEPTRLRSAPLTSFSCTTKEPRGAVPCRESIADCIACLRNRLQLAFDRTPHRGCWWSLVQRTSAGIARRYMAPLYLSAIHALEEYRPRI